MPLDAAQYFQLAFKKIDSAQIMLKPGVDEEAARKEIEKVLPKGISVRKPESRSPLAEETSLSTQQGMRMARAFSLIVAVFIIANTFLINVTQRRKQLGVMRAIGATRGQIARNGISRSDADGDHRDRSGFGSGSCSRLTI